MLGVLPFSHALGHTVTLWTPLLTGARLVLADAAGDPQALLELVRTERPTLLVATPALFARWVELFAPEDLSDVRLAISGGEHLPLATAQAWQARFGRPLHEGYGATELGPVVAVDLPDVERGGLTQSNHAAGTVGRSLPGIAVRVVRDEDGTPCEPDEEGAVLVRGPNLMAGWLDEHGALVCRLREGWYDTADVGALDRDGFLVVVDRRERFVEHGDRRVALARIEDALRSGHPGRLARLAAVRVEQAGGERVGIVHEPLDVLPQRLIELARAHLGSQAVLAERATWVEVPALPVLASGKLDLRALGRLLAAAVRCPDLR